MIEAGLRQARREGWGLYLYRLGLTFFLMVQALQAFPAQAGVVALAILVFNQGLAAVVQDGRLYFLMANRASDLAERKTRHAILAAHEPYHRERLDSHPDRPLMTSEFWAEVDQRVADEIMFNDTEPQRIPGPLLVIGNAFGRLLADLVLLMAAQWVSGVYI